MPDTRRGLPNGIFISDEKGTWRCFRCGIGGDAIELVKKALATDFIGALRWLGLEPGQPPALDPVIERQRRLRAGLRAWTRQRIKELSWEHYITVRVEQAAKLRLKRDAQDAMAWTWLQWALPQQPIIEYELGMLHADIPAQLEAFRRAA